jgi:hypothetical protein
MTILKQQLIKLFGTSFTSVTNAWDFGNDKVATSSFLSIGITAFVTFFNAISEKWIGVSGTLLCMIFVIITVDFLTGLTVAYRDQRRLRRKVICAAKGIRSAYKLGVYVVFLFCIHSLTKEYTGTWIADGLKYLHVYITIHIFFWESFSVDENMKKLGYDMGLSKTLKDVFQIFKRQKQ